MYEDRIEYRQYQQKQTQSQNEPKRINTQHLDSLINRQPSHQIKNIKPFDKNIELKFIVLSKSPPIKTKQGTIMTPMIIADSTGCIQMNVFDDYGTLIQESNTCYTQNAYATMYKDRLILYQGKQGILKQLSDYFFDFKTKPNISDQNWSEYLASKQNNNMN
ncbi:hypothetical protein ABPG74_011776 [Tetrahymena malaccensis]